MITDDPERITLYDLNGPAAFGLCRAVEFSRMRWGYPLSSVVREHWLAMPAVRAQYPNPETITAAHVQRLLTLAQAAGLL